MKKSIIFLIVSILFLSGCQLIKKQKVPVQLTIKFSFANKTVSLNGVAVDSFNYFNKIRVTIDGKVAGESSTKKQNESNYFSLQINPGVHNIQVVDLVFCKGKWEEHLVDNNFSADCRYSAIINLKENKTIVLIFDLGSGTRISE